MPIAVLYLFPEPRMKKTIKLIELRSVIRNMLIEDVVEPSSANADKAAKAPPGQWWNPSSYRYEPIPTGQAATSAADSATKAAADPMGHSQAASAHLAAAAAQHAAATVATERGDTDAAAVHGAESQRHHAAHWTHQQASSSGQPTQPEEGQSGQPSLPVGGTAPAPKGATSNQSKRV